MRHVILFAVLVGLSGCGYSAINSEAVGQVKKVAHLTPLFCPPQVEANISLGIIRNGTGSISKEDDWVVIPDPRDEEILRAAENSGKAVRITYNMYRFSFCTEEGRVATKVEVLD